MFSGFLEGSGNNAGWDWAAPLVCGSGFTLALDLDEWYWETKGKSRDKIEFVCIFLSAGGKWCGTSCSSQAPIHSSSLLADLRGLVLWFKITLASSLIETEHSHSQSFSTSHGELEEDKEQTTISPVTSSSKDYNAQLASAIDKHAFSMSLVEGLQLAVVILLLLIKRCIWWWSLNSLLCRPLRSHCSFNVNCLA